MVSPTVASSLGQLWALGFPPLGFLGTRAGARHFCRFLNARDPVTATQELACRGVAWFTFGSLFFVVTIMADESRWMLLLIPAWAIALSVYFGLQTRRLRVRTDAEMAH